MGRRRVITTASRRRSSGPARAFVLTLAVGLLLGFFLGRIIGGSAEQASPPVPQARTVMVEKTVRPPEKSAPAKRAPASTATTTPSVSASASVSP